MHSEERRELGPVRVRGALVSGPGRVRRTRRESRQRRRLPGSTATSAASLSNARVAPGADGDTSCRRSPWTTSQPDRPSPPRSDSAEEETARRGTPAGPGEAAQPIRTSASPRTGCCAPSCRRWSTPGSCSIEVIVATAALPIVRFGWPNCGWLRTLNASQRSSRLNRPNRVFLISDMSMLNCSGPRMCCGRRRHRCRCCRRAAGTRPARTTCRPSGRRPPSRRRRSGAGRFRRGSSRGSPCVWPGVNG